MLSRDQYIENMKAQLDKLNEQLGEWEVKGQEATESAKKKYAEQIAKLKEESTEAMAKFAELRASGQSNWESMMSEMDKVRDAFVHSYRYFKSQL